MFDRFKSTGNWAADLGRDLELVFWIGVSALVLVPVLAVALVLVWLL